MMIPKCWSVSKMWETAATSSCRFATVSAQIPFTINCNICTFWQEDSDSTPGKKRRRKTSTLTMNDMSRVRKVGFSCIQGIRTISVRIPLHLRVIFQSKHRCKDDCACVDLDRGTLRKRLSTTEENHMRENLRCEFYGIFFFSFSVQFPCFFQTWTSARY